MPTVIQGQSDADIYGKRYENVTSLASSKPYDYDYKSVVGVRDLRPGNPVHDQLVTRVIAMADASLKHVQARFPQWKEIDRVLTAYIPHDEDEKAVQKKDSRKPVSIVIPVSYAILDTIMTYYSAAFLEEPYFRYSGVGPDDMLGAMMMEAAVAYQCRRGKIGLDLYAGWRSGAVYGVAYYYIGYERRHGWRDIEEEEDIMSKFQGLLTGKKKKVQKRRKVVTYEGGTLDALDPYKCFPDPEVPAHDVKNMSFFGWVDRMNIHDLISEETSNPEDFVNCKYVQHMSGVSKYNRERADSGRNDKTGGTREDGKSGVTKPVDNINMFVKLIPSDWGLGDSDESEVYIIRVSGDKVVTRCQPVGYDHNEIPIAVNAPDFDGFSMSPISRMETIFGLQHTLDWMYKSHMTNVRKAINNTLVVDPQIINVWDLINLKEGGIIRTRRSAFGRGLKEGIMQLPITDVTSGNVNDTAVLRDWANNISGAQDVVQGVRRQGGERVSATEASGTMKAALSRLEKMAKITSMMAHHDIAYQMAYNTRQLMTEDTWFKLIGDWDPDMLGAERVESGRMRVTKSDLNIDFDVEPHDGTVPGSGDPGVWIQLYQAVAQNPVLAQNLDMVKLFKFGARLAGAKNLNDFVLQGGQVNTQVMPDEEVMNEAQKGNLGAVPTVQ